MPIICLEGASAVGKTVLSTYLSENFGAFVIPEVNLLFEKKKTEQKFWYIDKQVERWKMANEAAKNHEIVVLDGDPFQPLWYNWAYNFDFGEPFEEIAENYWMALLRDVPFAQYSANPLAYAAAADLNLFGADFKGAKNGGVVITDTLFRGLTPGGKAGPYLSQFFYQSCNFGANKVNQKI